MKRFLALLCILTATACFTACGSNDGQSASDSSETVGGVVTQPDAEVTTPAQETEQPAVTEVTEKPEPVVTTQPDEEIIPNVAEYIEFSASVEAQDGVYEGNISEDNKLENASDGTYLTGFADADTDKWSYELELPASQYYNIVLVIASDKDVSSTASLVIDGEEYGKVYTSGSGQFEAVGYDNIWIEQGTHTLGIGLVAGTISLDYMIVSASDTVSLLDLSFETLPQLSNPNADAKASAVYRYLAQIYGKNILSGQYDTVSTTAETDAIYHLTGHYPAIRFGDMISYTEEDTYADDVELAIEWAENGGLVGYMWHWQDPMGSDGYYLDNVNDNTHLSTDFDVTKAVTELDIACIPYEDLATMCTEGGISSECLAIVRDIDIVSQQLIKLRDKGVTVLWRPLHEASGGWFWWGRDVSSYKWLWNLMYDRMTNYHNLNNLIWIWNGQNPDWYVGDDRCDMISADIYGDDSSSKLGAFLSLRRICTDKMLALSECGTAPDIQTLANEKTMWSFFGIWSGGYVIDEYGEYSDSVISKEDMIALYSNSVVICRDELPDFDELASMPIQEDVQSPDDLSSEDE